MNYIFVSSKRESLKPLYEIKREELSFAEYNNQPYRCELHFRTVNETRLLDCYSFNEQFEENEAAFANNTAHVFHGYLLDGSVTIGDGGYKLEPRKCYYGVYSHGRVTEEDCYFSSDEIGLSPVYYSREGGYIFVSNNPHLIVLYKLKLGFTVNPEPTLPLWHSMRITIESDNTGYEGVYRVRPWRYIFIDNQDDMNFPSKDRLDVGEDYESAVPACVEEMRKGMRTIKEMKNRIPNLLADITGGYDSRLTLAFLLDAGFVREFKFTTGGHDVNPDVIISKMIAEKYKLNHKHNYSQIVPVDYDLNEFNKTVEKKSILNAMEVATIRLDGIRAASRKNDYKEIKLNGKASEYTKVSESSIQFIKYMNSRFKNEPVDFDNLTQEQKNISFESIGHGGSYKSLLTNKSFEISNNFRKYIFDFGYSRFPKNMNYADSMAAYRYRTHTANLDISEHSCIFLYSPALLETSRKLDPKLRQEAKLYFDIMYKIQPELCYIPFENRTYYPGIYEEYPADVKERLSQVQAVTGSIVSETNKSIFEYLLPVLRENLIDMLPQSVFEYIKKDALEARLNEDFPFGTPTYPLVNLYGIARWHEIVKNLNWTKSRVTHLISAIPKNREGCQICGAKRTDIVSVYSPEAKRNTNNKYSNNNELKKENEELKKQNDRYKKRYEAWENSKIGKIQNWYWNRKKNK